MNGTTPPIQEDDLHGFIDGQLDEERRDAVARYLVANPEAARRVAAFQAQRDAIRAAFAVRDTEAPAGELSLAHIIAQRNRRPPRPWLFAASVAAALGIGLAGGWWLHTVPAPGITQQAMAVLEQEALTSHSVYAADRRHPIEVPGAEAPHLQQWLSNRLERSVVAPDLSALGYHLLGGRLLATERGGAAALLMYDDVNHQRISVLLRPMATGLRSPSTLIRKDGVSAQVWITDGMGIAVIAAVPEDDIARLATQVGAAFGARG